eukprot:3376047-Lingulodinium_polyedra.AAC.1
MASFTWGQPVHGSGHCWARTSLSRAASCCAQAAECQWSSRSHGSRASIGTFLCMALPPRAGRSSSRSMRWTSTALDA